MGKQGAGCVVGVGTAGVHGAVLLSYAAGVG